MASTDSSVSPSLEVSKAGSLKSPPKDSGPLLDEQGNILPYPDYQVQEEKYCKTSPIPRLAVAASLKKEVPTAGWYWIERSKEPNVVVPPECYLYDKEIGMTLGKLSKASLDLPEPAEPVPLPQAVLDYLNDLEAKANAEITRKVRAQAEGIPEDRVIEKGTVPEINEKLEEASVKSDESIKLDPKAEFSEKLGELRVFEGTLEEAGITPLEETPGITVTPEATEPVSVAEQKKPRNPSASSPPTKGVRRSSRSSTPTSPRIIQLSKPRQPQEKPKTPKSPGRDAQPKLTSPRSGSKKTVNAKVDVEVVEKKN